MRLQNLTPVNGSVFSSVSTPKVKLDLRCLILSLKKVLKLFANVESSSEAGKLVRCWLTSKLEAVELCISYLKTVR